MIDLKQLQAIAGDSPELVMEILEDFEKEANAGLAEVGDRLSGQDHGGAKSLFHQLAGSSGTLGLSAVHDQARALEGACVNGTISHHSLEDFGEILRLSVEQARQQLGVR